MPKLSTQDFLEFEQIREGVIILKNKALRAVLMVSSLNFALKSEEEQAGHFVSVPEFFKFFGFSLSDSHPVQKNQYRRLSGQAQGN